MVYFKSLFPSPPPVPDSNIHNYMFDTENANNIKDYTLHIDAITGRKRSFHEFRQRVRDGATALELPVASGGLGLSREAGDIVGIYSSNSLVGLIRLCEHGPLTIISLCCRITSH